MTENIFTLLAQEVRGALAALVPDLPAETLARVQVEPPREAAHGDMATNAALVAAKPARMPPPKLAAALAERLLALPMVAEAAPAGPGFVNLRLREDFLRAQIPAVLRAGEAYGDSTLGGRLKVNVEYVSANPTGPMHVGHCRGAVVGDALAEEWAWGTFDVIYAGSVLHAFADMDAAARALRRRLKPGGVLVAWEPMNTGWAVRLARADPRWRFVWVGWFGDDAEARAVKALLAEAGTSQIEVTGWVGDPERILGGADVFCMFSRYESFGYITAEVMLTGVPVVAVDGSGTRDLVRDGDTGVMVEAQIEAICRSLEECRRTLDLDPVTWTTRRTKS